MRYNLTHIVRKIFSEEFHMDNIMKTALLVGLMGLMTLVAACNNSSDKAGSGDADTDTDTDSNGDWDGDTDFEAI